MCLFPPVVISRPSYPSCAFGAALLQRPAFRWITPTIENIGSKCPLREGGSPKGRGWIRLAEAGAAKQLRKGKPCIPEPEKDFSAPRSCSGFDSIPKQHAATARNDEDGMVLYIRYTVFTGECHLCLRHLSYWSGRAVCLDTSCPFSSAPIFHFYDIIFYIHCKFTFMYWYCFKSGRII